MVLMYRYNNKIPILLQPLDFKKIEHLFTV